MLKLGVEKVLFATKIVKLFLRDNLIYFRYKQKFVTFEMNVCV